MHTATSKFIHSRQPHPSRERGASELMMLAFMTVLLAFAGLAYDAGMAFNARRQASNIAHSAARAGANQVETDALYTVGLPLIDESKARRAVRNHVQASGLTLIKNDASGLRMTVKVQAEHETTFLHIVGIPTMTVEAEARVMAQNLANS